MNILKVHREIINILDAGGKRGEPLGVVASEMHKRSLAALREPVRELFNNGYIELKPAGGSSWFGYGSGNPVPELDGDERYRLTDTGRALLSPK
jgi:hypothetical protein